MKALIVGVVVALLTIGGTASAQAPAPSCEEEIGPLRYLVRLYGQTRTEVEFEMAKQRARADRAEAEVARLRALLPTGKTEGK